MSTVSTTLVRWLAARVGIVVVVSLVVSAALAVPLVTMQPEGSASQEPEGEVFEARDLAAARFVSAAYDIPFVVEAREGDLLTKDSLLELLDSTAAMRADPRVGPKLFSYFDRGLGVEVHGAYTLADAVEEALLQQGQGGVAEAEEATIRQVAGAIIDEQGPGQLGLSARAARDPGTGEWVVPGLVMIVAGDDERVGGPPAGVQLGIDDTTKEEFNREVQTLLRGSETHIQVWGIGFDVNLTSAEQGEAAGPFIGLTILAVLLVVGLTYRSYWPVAIAGGALALMIIWLRGLSNLVGMEQDQILATIVPIAMISFGIDFAFHAFGRYREERDRSQGPRAAFTIGLAGVLGALVLALSSDAAAFLANTASGIQSLVQFGIAAAFGLFAAFVLLGLVAPAVLMRIEERAGEPPRGGWVRAAAAVGAVAAAMAATASVLLTVFLAPLVGVLLAGFYVAAFVFAPTLLASRLGGHARTAAVERSGRGRGAAVAGSLVARVARGRAIVVPAVFVATVVCAYYAVQVPAQFDVKDFFSPSSSFVVSLDKLDEHGGAGGGEPAVVYVEADLSEPGSITALDRFVVQLQELDTAGLARDDDGQVRVETGVLAVLADAVASPAARTAVATSGAAPEDADGDGYPDDADQLDAIYDHALREGLPLDSGGLGWTAEDVAEVLWRSASRDEHATRLEVLMPGTREQETIARTEEDLQPLIDDLEAGLQATAPDARAVLTGAPIARQHSLDAISRALQVSLPIAIVLCLLIAAAVMRSIRYAVASIVPIVLVVAWLYAFMYAFGFSLNIVTATIGAISIGIGIDYSIHFTMRFREELTAVTSRDDALRASGEGTGLALAASALSSVVGFAILAFAPMPLFASYGLLTAVMIVMAVAASLLVLPSLLAVVTRDPAPVEVTAAAMAAGQPVHDGPRTGTIAQRLDLEVTPAGEGSAMPAATPLSRETVRAASPDLPPAAPPTIGGLRIVRSLGRDRDSELYLAVSPEGEPGGQVTGGEFTVRVYREPLTAGEFDLVTDELEAYRSVASSRLVPLHDYGRWQGRLFVTSDHLPQGSLADKAHTLSTPEVLQAVVDAARAAHDLHEAGIVHRDLRPEKVLLTGEGARLAGVGIPQLVSESRRLSGDGAVAVERGNRDGPTGYVDPMVLAGSPAGRASDIWSLGATLRSTLADPSPQEQAVIRRCLDPDRKARFATALALADAIQALQVGRESAG